MDRLRTRPCRVWCSCLCFGALLQRRVVTRIRSPHPHTRACAGVCAVCVCWCAHLVCSSLHAPCLVAAPCHVWDCACACVSGGVETTDERRTAVSCLRQPAAGRPYHLPARSTRAGHSVGPGALQSATARHFYPRHQSPSRLVTDSRQIDSG